MSEERFEDKTLVKKEEEKIKSHAATEETKEEKKEAVEKKIDAEKKEKEEKTEKAEKKEEKKAQAFVLERKYNVNLSAAYAKPRFKRANAAVRLLRRFSLKHMKAKRVVLATALNNALRKSARPLKRLTLVLQKDKDGTAYASLAQ